MPAICARSREGGDWTSEAALGSSLETGGLVKSKNLVAIAPS
jgi:hypothetical protein